MSKNKKILTCFFKLVLAINLIFLGCKTFAQEETASKVLQGIEDSGVTIINQSDTDTELIPEIEEVINVEKSGTDESSTPQESITTIKSREINPEEISSKETKSAKIIKYDSRVTDSRYTITPGDILSFSVYGEPELTQKEIKVRPDGYATIEPIGELFVANKDIHELTSKIHEDMSIYFKDPQICLNVKKFNPASIYIYGAVKKPGFYQQNIETPTVWHDAETANAKTDLSLTNVLSITGGVNYNADLSNIKISNNFTGYTREVDLWKLLDEGDTAQNIRLKSGDSVFVPEMDGQIYSDEDFKKIAVSSIHSDNFIVKVVGEVKQPGLYNLPTETPNLNSAIAMAQGYTIDAKRKAVQIYRKTPEGNISVININPEKIDYMLRPDDLVYVRDRTLMKAVRTGDYFTRIFGGLTSPARSFNQWAEVFNPDRRFGW